MPDDDPLSPNAGSATITRSARRVQALFSGHLLADSGDVLVMRRAGEAPEFFFPRKDVEMAVLQENDHRSRSSLGEARSFTITRDAQIVEDVARAYSRPAAPYAALAGRIAFARAYVDIRETELEADAGETAVFEGDVDEVVRHTDSGAGFSQEAAWEPTVSEPKAPDSKPYSGVGSL